MVSAQDIPTGLVQTDALNVRSGAGPAYPVVATVHYGDYVYLLGRDSASLWVYVRLFDNVTEGWLNSKYIRSTVTISSLPQMADYEASAIVLAYTLNIRSGPSSTYPIVGTVTQLNFVQMLERDTNGIWVKIRTNSGVIGWVHSGWLSPLSSINDLAAAPVESLPATEAYVPTATVTAYALNVRTGPDIAYPPITVIYAGHYVTLLGRDTWGVWVKIRTASGTEGWVHTHWINTHGTDVMTLPDMTPTY